MIDVKAVLNQNIGVLDASEGTVEWTHELVAQVYTLSQICLQQQEQIDVLLRRSMGGIF